MQAFRDFEEVVATGSVWQYEKCDLYGALVLLVFLFSCGGCSAKTVVGDFSPRGEMLAQYEPPKKYLSISEALRLQYASWKGVRHRAGGADKRGVDCSGLMQAVFRDAFRVNLPRTSLEQSRMGRKVKKITEMRPGDLVFFVDRGLDHIGVVMDRRRFLHASTKHGVIVSEFDEYWVPRLKRISRVLNVN